MKHLMTFLLLASFIFFPKPSEAQFLKKMIKRTREEINDNFGERVIEGLAKEIADAVIKPTNESWDSLMQATYRDSTGNNGGDFNAFMLGLDKSSEVRESYHFDIIVSTIHTDFKGRKSKMKTYVSKSGEHFAIENQNEEGGLVIFDAKKDIMIMLNEKDGEKTGQAITSTMKLAGKYVDKHMTYSTPTPTGKTKTILGYNCEEYTCEDDKEDVSYYVAKNFPITYQESFGVMMSQFGSKRVAELGEAINGFVLESTTTKKSKKKKSSKYETTEISKDAFTVKKADYKFTSFSESK